MNIVIAFRNACTFLSLVPRLAPIPSYKTRKIMEDDGWRFSSEAVHGTDISAFRYAIKNPEGEKVAPFSPQYLEAARRAYKERREMKI